jgi:heat shock protein HslJ
MDTQRLTLAVLTVVPLMVACGSGKADGGSGSVAVERPVTGVDWSVRDITVNGTTTAAHGSPYLAFDAKTHKAGGRLGCNHVNATATVRAGHITLGRAMTTRMMCDASLMHTEKSLLRLFGGTVSYRLDHRKLTLTSENGETVTAVAQG